MAIWGKHEQVASRWSPRKEPAHKEGQSQTGDRAQVLGALSGPLKIVKLNLKLAFN